MNKNHLPFEKRASTRDKKKSNLGYTRNTKNETNQIRQKYRTQAIITVSLVTILLMYLYYMHLVVVRTHLHIDKQQRDEHKNDLHIRRKWQKQQRLGFEINALKYSNLTRNNDRIDGQENTTNVEMPESFQHYFEPINIVHVITTRFMQHQPHLTHLGHARLQLFETFCLPTIIHQSSQNFLWIIRVDPDLEKSLEKRLIELLSMHATDGNIIVIRSNDNPEGFRGSDDILPENIIYGKYNLYKYFLNASLSKILCETRLDADDGVNIYFVEHVQRLAQRHLGEPNNSLNHSAEKDNKKWMVWCLNEHMEWHSEVVQNDGIQDTNESNYERYKMQGVLLPIRNIHCITPGLTFGYAPHAGRGDIGKKIMHQDLHKIIPPCEGKESYKCLSRLTHKEFQFLLPAIRARTPTSAGMANVGVVQPNIVESKYNNQDQCFLKIHSDFHIDFHLVVKSAAMLSKNRRQIALDNLNGQCTKGHSCKTESKNILESIIN